MLHMKTLFLQFIFLSIVAALEIKTFCKCFCGSNSTVFELSLKDAKPCSNCTKQFCLDNVKDGLCDGIADETCPSNDFRTACFARDSYKDEIIVRSFLIATFILIVYAAIKPFLVKFNQAQRATEYSSVPSEET